MGRWDPKEQNQNVTSLKVALVIFGAIALIVAISSIPSFFDSIQGGFTP